MTGAHSYPGVTGPMPGTENETRVKPTVLGVRATRSDGLAADLSRGLRRGSHTRRSSECSQAKATAANLLGPPAIREGQVSRVAKPSPPLQPAVTVLRVAAHRGPHPVGPTASDTHWLIGPPLGAVLVGLAARSDGLYRLLARTRAARVDTGHRDLLVIGTAVAAAPHLWRCSDHVQTRGGRAGTRVPRQHWRGTVVGSAARRLRDARDRVTKSTRRAHASQRRADRTIDTPHFCWRARTESGAAHRSTPHTPARRGTTVFFAVIAVYDSVRLTSSTP